jgi:Kdo2-lipid IVA lauroyltransferase/acyltransferase
MLIFLGYKFLEFLVFTTPYPVTYFIANNGAKFIHAIGYHSGIVNKNISIVIGKDPDSPEVKRIVRKIYCNWFLNVTDFLKHPLVKIEKFNERIELIGKEHLDNELKKNKGAILFTAHIGNFEWGACRLATAGFKIWGTALTRKSVRTMLFFEKRRLAKGLKTLYVNKVMLNIFRILKNNEVLAIPSDFDPLGTARIYKFFGHDAHIPSGPVEIALKSGAPLLPSFIWRKDKYNHKLIIGPPIDLIPDTGNGTDREEILKLNMQKMISVMEKYIHEHIEQWEMFHDIWR